MPLDPSAQRLLHMLSVGGATDLSRADLNARRRALANLMQFADKQVACGQVDARDLPGGAIGARIYTPVDAPAGALPGLVFFHGGGFVAGSLDTHDPLCRVLANETGCRIVAVDYRLAPEHKFPAAVTDAATAARDVLTHAADLGLDPTRIGIGGDSAGAVLAIAACVAARQAGGRQPALQLLLCPITDFVNETESRRQYASGHLIDKTTIERDLVHYLPSDAHRADPRVSPLHMSDFAGLPPAFIHTAEFDPFRDEGQAYSRALLDAGVAAAYTCHPGMLHLFYAMPAVIPYARRAMRSIGAEIKAALQQA